MKKALKWTECIFWMLILSLFFSFLLTGLVTKKPTLFGVRPFYIVSESMEPTIHKGQFILTVSVKASDVKDGDIIVYRMESKISPLIAENIIHRVKYTDGDTFIFRGDNNPVDDEPVSASQIKYKVIRY